MALSIKSVQESLEPGRSTVSPLATGCCVVIEPGEQHLRETRTMLPFMPGWQHIDPRIQAELPGRFDDVISVIDAWLALFDEATNGKGPAILVRWVRANKAWTELFNRC